MYQRYITVIWRSLSYFHSPTLTSAFFFFFPNRGMFQVSVFDSIVQGGDGVWEGLRVYNGKIFKLEEHLDR